MCQDKGYIGDSDFGEEHLEHCTVEMFGRLSNKELAAFIMARQASVEPEFASKSKLPNKGSVKEATEQGVRNRIQVAFEYREKPNTIHGKYPYDLSALEEEEEELNASAPPIVIALGGVEDVSPTQLLSNKQWVTNAIALLDLEKFDVNSDVSKSDMDNADLLVKNLRVRYHEHLKARIKSKEKRTHWSMKFAYKNLSVSAACMVLSKHVKMDLSCLCEGDGLLAPSTTNFFHCTRFPKREGAYLYFDTNRGAFVRSGKVARRGFVDRGNEHEREAKATKASSHFYFLYPSETLARKSKRDKQGLFEHLTQMIAAGFDPDSDHANLLDKDWKEGGIFILSEEDKANIKESLDKSITSVQKFQDIAAYQFEFGYDLAISPGLNVSRSPGFESVLGIFGGGD